MQKKYIPLLIFFTALLAFAVHLGARLTAEVPAFSLADEEKRIYLTFDDGPSTVVTNRVLDILREEGVQATFFIVSDRVAGREETLRRIVREGHTVGVHSKTHRYGEIYASDEALLGDVRACAETVEQITGTKPRFYRFPYGGGTARQRDLLEAQGYTVVGWNAVCGDTDLSLGAEALVKESLKTAGTRGNVVLLLHDGAPHKATAEALPAIISAFRARGYAFCAFR